MIESITLFVVGVAVGMILSRKIGEWLDGKNG